MPSDAAPWQPSPATELGFFPECGSDEPAELCDAQIVRARLSLTEQLHGVQVVNAALLDCDVSGLIALRSRVSRVLVRSTRLRSVTWLDGVVEDLTMDRVQGTEISLRFSRLRRVTVRESSLPGLDLTEVRFEQVRFEGCDLRGARFDHARVKSLRIEGCDLTGATGAGSLTGASVDPRDLLCLAPSLARALAIRIE